MKSVNFFCVRGLRDRIKRLAIFNWTSSPSYRVHKSRPVVHTGFGTAINGFQVLGCMALAGVGRLAGVPLSVPAFTCRLFVS